MGPFENTLEAWSKAHPVKNPPASPDRLFDLSKIIGTDLPAEVVAFYELCDGVPDFEYDAHHVCFWSIERIRIARDERAGDRGIAFADFLINSWCFEFVIENGEVRVWVGAAGSVAGSFAEFLEAYVERPETFPVL